MGKSKVLEGDVNRRSFIKGAAGISAASLFSGSVINRNVLGVNDSMRVAVLGLNGRGWAHVEGLQELDGVEVVTFCDPDSDVLEQRAAEFKNKYGRGVHLEKDLRKVYDDKNIDAVAIATPNHWHALATIWACQAGKDVYVEKPGSHTFWEGRKMVEAAAKYKRIVQHGTQSRSSTVLQEAVEHLRKGTIGEVYMARGLIYRWREDIGVKPMEPVPNNLDYDLWTGPARKRPFSRNIVHYNWHWHWDYGNGDIGNQGIHQTDICLWGLDVGLPRRITSMGGKFLWDDAKETPEVLSSTYHYPEEKKIIEVEVRPWCTNTEEDVAVGNIFYGSEGYMAISGSSFYRTFLGQNREPGPSAEQGSNDHFANFVEAVRSRDEKILTAPVEHAHKSSALAHLGNIAYKLGRVLEFDPASEFFVGDEEADRMLRRRDRDPFVVPERV
ncbi:MAG: Gfo/Idh/MocA family oxidoreductase [Acidobacteriota bacterium]